MPLIQDHSCKECTKPYKPRPDENPAAANDNAPVIMAVVDSIVTGPIVSDCFKHVFMLSILTSLP